MLNVVVTGTGPLFTLDEAKAHLRVDFSDEDALIEAYAEAAVQACMSYVNRSLVPVGAEPSFKVAALMTLASLYDSRAAVVLGQTFGVSPNVAALLDASRLIRV
ncbi:head-tail connector protein [Brevundimonas aurantiaca]|jgi:uncharacterized phage protein (predicted DNA packaging)|uniref:head-tail connector protein n=1 Tax=Brevundimonas aurantiaca TaxID=74316 RepID=UPI00301965C3